MWHAVPRTVKLTTAIVSAKGAHPTSLIRTCPASVFPLPYRTAPLPCSPTMYPLQINWKHSGWRALEMTKMDHSSLIIALKAALSSLWPLTNLCSVAGPSGTGYWTIRRKSQSDQGQTHPSTITRLTSAVRAYRSGVSFRHLANRQTRSTLPFPTLRLIYNVPPPSLSPVFRSV
ncbi:hypothetical protein BV22DRAFT_699646 [Leucogyrophana mollusca]|uniref:Uncharacterized protein n=1 Tax=Leucogyrophana mollusca TaxID=85980 RepID=A0ACB8B8N4_9AGAM|nr:hypothetical protein BV22DRAFT_699646 [Leucogyrophana mollusca]